MKKLVHLVIIFSMLFTMTVVNADTEPVTFSNTKTNPCSVTIDQDLTFTIPNAIYDAGPFIGKTALKLDFTFFGEQNGQLLWQFADAGNPPSSPTCSVSIEPDLSFTLTDVVYDAGPSVGKIAFQADFKYSGEQNGVFLWHLADIKTDDEPSDPTPTTPVALSKTQVTLESGNSETITISGGTGNYTGSTSNRQVATAVISGSSVEVTGLSAGTATVIVSDTGGETASISVTVSTPTTPPGNCGIDAKNIDTYSLRFYSWNHSILSGCAASSAEIELYIKVWTFNDYGTLDLFCSNTTTFDFGSVTTATRKPGFIRRISRTTTPDSRTYYTITSTLNATQRGWLNDDGVIYFALIGYPYNMYGFPAQFDLSKSVLDTGEITASP